MSAYHQARIVWGCRVDLGPDNEGQDAAEEWEARTGLTWFPVSGQRGCDGVLGVEVMVTEGVEPLDLDKVAAAQASFARRVEGRCSTRCRRRCWWPRIDSSTESST